MIEEREREREREREGGRERREEGRERIIEHGWMFWRYIIYSGTPL